MVVSREFRREIVENVSRIAASGQQNDGPARATPIEHFQPNLLVYGYKLRSVR
ncbi:MAG: hypothetical protein WB679_07435 [Terracidiphilus sp.]